MACSGDGAVPKLSLAVTAAKTRTRPVFNVANSTGRQKVAGPGRRWSGAISPRFPGWTDGKVRLVGIDLVPRFVRFSLPR